MKQTLVAEKLNHLAAILDDASEGYLTASKYAGSKELGSFFEKLSYQRSDFARQIKKLLHSIDALTYSKGGFLSLLHRTWKDMCFQLKSKDKSVVKSCCIIGEKFASNYYESILADPQIPAIFKNVLSNQLNAIHGSLKNYEAVKTPVEKSIVETTAGVTNDSAEKKISFLISYLQQVSKDFEMIAEEIDDKNLRNVFFALSEEDKEFATDLQNQVSKCGLCVTAFEHSLYWDYLQEDIPEGTAASKQNELLQICDRSEYLFLKLYTDALREFFSFKPLMDVMIYQYNSIRAGFLKLRLLTSVRYNNPVISV